MVLLVHQILLLVFSFHLLQDKACEEVDYQVRSSGSSYESSTDDEDAGIKKKQQAILEKEKVLFDHFLKRKGFAHPFRSFGKILNSAHSITPPFLIAFYSFGGGGGATNKGCLIVGIDSIGCNIMTLPCYIRL